MCRVTLSKRFDCDIRRKLEPVPVKIKTVEGHLYNARNLSYLKVGREVTLGRQIVDKGLDSTTLSENA